ncbi:MAG: hypothetical protein ACOY5H_06040 [Pseudomonadota bacterium]
MSEPLRFERWSPMLEAVLRRYLMATSVPASEHAGLLTGVALTLGAQAAPGSEAALPLLVQAVQGWLAAHHRVPTDMPAIHRGAMLSPSLKPLPWGALLRHATPGGDDTTATAAEATIRDRS